jgi:CHAD domain-containing protein
MNNSQEAKTLGDWAKIAIQQHYQKILNHEPLVLKDKDPEELHQMRVGMRRLRTAIVAHLKLSPIESQLIPHGNPINVPTIRI